MAVIEDLRAYLSNLSAKDVDALHRNADTDTSRRALHHTLGTKGTQASPGNHTHDGNDSSLLDIEGMLTEVPWSKMSPEIIPDSNLPSWLRGDSGWVDIPLSSGISVQDVGQSVQVRKIGIQVYWRGAFKQTTGSFPANGTVTIVDTGDIPAAFLPDSVVTGAPYIYHSAGNLPESDAQIRLTANGALELRVPATVSPYYTTASIMYLGAFSG